MAGQAVEGDGSGVESAVADTCSVGESCVGFAGQALVDSRAVAGEARSMACRELAVTCDGQRVAGDTSAGSV